MKISITHNNPRFTLAGLVNNKTTHGPESNVTVTAVNTTQNSTVSMQNQQGSGTFNFQLNLKRPVIYQILKKSITPVAAQCYSIFADLLQ
jgi:hypothetical protein